MGLQTDEKDRWLNQISAKNGLQLSVISHGLADRFRSFIDHVEGVVHRHVIPEARIRQHPATLQNGAKVVAHAHLANELLRAGCNADLEIAHARLHHELSQFGVQIVGADVGGPTNAGQPFSLDRPQQFLGVFDVAPRRYELGIGEPETTNPAVVQLAHLFHHLIHGVEAHLLAFHHRVNAITTVVGAAALGLNSNVKVTAFEVPVELGPDRSDVVVIAGGFGPTFRLLMDQA